MDTSRHASKSLPQETLGESLERAGFYPELVTDVVGEALDGRECLAHLVHVEPHFDRNEVHRHVTVLALTDDVLITTHVDDEQLDEVGDRVAARVSIETVALEQIRSVALGYRYDQPQNYRPGDRVREVTLTLSWFGGQRFDLLPASCGDPECDADHGYTGSLVQEDLTLRVSEEADGWQEVQRAKDFARILGEVGRSAPETVSPLHEISFSGRLLRGYHH